MAGMMIFLLMNLLAASVKAQHFDREREVASDQLIDSDKDSLQTRCYDKWGCLSIGEPFFSSLRPISLFPLHPDVMDVQFLLVTRSAPDLFERVRTRNSSSSGNSNFDSTRPTKIIIHGFREKGDGDWIKEMIRELLTADDYNVFSVDWRVGAASAYPQAVANTRTLALVVADFINNLQRTYGVSPSDIHIIGHNLGAHAAGYVGEKMSRLGRITGLDPAGPYFEDTEPVVRLDPNDAEFVDIIHSDNPRSGGLVPVMLQPSGNVDFYPTPGWRRTRCNSLAGKKSFRRCINVHAPDLFSESINIDCPFYGYKCNSYANFSSGNCREGCGSDSSNCASMGYKADEWSQFSSSQPVTMFLETGLDEPHCRYHYHFNVLLSGSDEETKQRNETGLLFVRLTGSKRKTNLLQAIPQPVVFTRGNNLEFLLSSPNLGRLLRVDAFWSTFRPTHLGSKPSSIYIHRFRITNLETSYRETFCGDNKPLYPELVKVFFRGGSC